MSLILRSNIYHYDFIVDGMRYRGSTGNTNKIKAKQIEDELKVQYRSKQSIEMVFEQTKRKLIAHNNTELKNMWDDFRKKSLSDAGDRRIILYKSHIAGFVSFMCQKYPAVQNVANITPEHARDYIIKIRAMSGANSTKNDKLATLKMVFDTLGKSSGIIENPFSEIAPLSMDKISREAFTFDELKLIGDKATGWIYSLCLTALSTGLREGDICLLKKSSINLKAGWIAIPSINKTGKPLEIPIMPQLAVHLKDVISTSEYVFPELAKIYQNNPCCIGKKIKEFFISIGIEDSTKTIDGYTRKLSSKDIHSFRHTFVYLAALHGIPFPIVQSIVGHGSPAMTKIYMNHAGREAKSKYLSALPAYLSQGVKKRDLTTDRVIRMIEKLSSENLEKNKKRIIHLLST